MSFARGSEQGCGAPVATHSHTYRPPPVLQRAGELCAVGAGALLAFSLGGLVSFGTIAAGHAQVESLRAGGEAGGEPPAVTAVEVGRVK